MIQAIAHPTDFSPEGQAAFVHALRLALAFRCRLDLLHVRDPRDHNHFDRFPHVREVLQRWGVLAPGAAVEDITARTGVTVRKIEIRDGDAVDGLARFLKDHRPDLTVMATHGRDGLSRWLHGSVSSEITQETHVPTLLLGPEARPFADPVGGGMTLARVLVPVARDPAPEPALRRLLPITGGLGVTLKLVHVGPDAPQVRDASGALLPVREIEGPVVEGILAEARASDVDLIAMPTAGPHGLFDALRGSTTERVAAQAPCPVLALPA